MIGVILWSDPEEEKAVIWCEDHGDLAFLSRPDAIQLPDAFVDVGDVVEFELKAQMNTRKVSSIKILSGGRAPHVVQSLAHANSPAPRHSSASAEVIPFRLHAPTRTTTHARAKVQRQG